LACNVFAGALGIVYRLAYYLFGKNLWPLIVVHGVWNSVAISRMYGL
jgi:membrane protease YdiL (CAAX protease family)